MRIHVLGTGGAFTERLGNTAFVVEQDGFCLGIDCPDGYRQVLAGHRERSGSDLTLEAIDAWVLTHLHGDHCNGLEGIAFYRHFVHGTKTTLYAPEDVATTFGRDRLASSMGRTRGADGLWQTFQREDFFDVWRLHPGVTALIGPFQVEIRRTDHHLPGTAVRVSAGGQTWANSSDTTFDPDLLAWLASADLIFHECGDSVGHTPYARLAELPPAQRAKLRLVHYPDHLQPDPETLRLAKPGEIYPLGEPR